MRSLLITPLLSLISGHPAEPQQALSLPDCSRLRPIPLLPLSTTSTAAADPTVA